MAFDAHINSEKFIIALSALITRKKKKKRPPEFGVSHEELRAYIRTKVSKTPTPKLRPFSSKYTLTLSLIGEDE